MSNFISKRRLGATIVTIAVSLSAHAYAQPARGGTPQTEHTMTSKMQGKSHAAAMEKSDQRFLVESAMSNMAEVKLGQLALDTSQEQSVKTYAQRLVDDHGKTMQQLKDLTREFEIKMPDRPDRAHLQAFTKLSRVSGAEFDRAYINEMVKDHQKDIQEFEKEASEAKNDKVKNFASDTLPTLRDHLKSAQEISRQLGQGKKSST